MSELVFSFINILTIALLIAIFARVVVSWLPVEGTNPAVTLIYQITEPILRPIRNVLPSTGMLDLSPVVAIVVIIIVRRIFL